MAGWGNALASRLRRWAGWLLHLTWLWGETPMVPRHVGFIMDGNRRFADRERIPTKSGHSRGYDKVRGVAPPSNHHMHCYASLANASRVTDPSVICVAFVDLRFLYLKDVGYLSGGPRSHCSSVKTHTGSGCRGLVYSPVHAAQNSPVSSNTIRIHPGLMFRCITTRSGQGSNQPQSRCLRGGCSDECQGAWGCAGGASTGVVSGPGNPVRVGVCVQSGELQASRRGGDCPDGLSPPQTSPDPTGKAWTRPPHFCLIFPVTLSYSPAPLAL